MVGEEEEEEEEKVAGGCDRIIEGVLEMEWQNEMR